MTLFFIDKKYQFRWLSQDSTSNFSGVAATALPYIPLELAKKYQAKINPLPKDHLFILMGINAGTDLLT
jgi:hypothetical protein